MINIVTNRNIKGWPVKKINTITDNYLRYLISRPVVVLDKSELPFIIWYSQKNPKNNNMASNSGNANAIVLDYDNGYSINEFQDQFRNKFKYYLHTSFSHTAEKHKFRVIIPLEMPFLMSSTARTFLLEYFPNIDPTCLNYRGFYAPGLTPGSNYYYQCNNNVPFWNWSDHTERILKIRWELKWKEKSDQGLLLTQLRENERIFSNRDTADRKHNLENYYTKILINMEWTRDSGFDVHSNLLKITGAMSRNFTPNEIYAIVTSVNDSTETIKDLRGMLR
jgi:hypothetical protein